MKIESGAPSAEWDCLHALAARQHGLITARQAKACGMSVAALRRLCARQHWERILPGVVALPGSLDSPHRRLSALMLHIGQPAAVTGWSAAWLHGLRPAPPARTDVLLPAERRRPRLAAVNARRTRLWRDDHLTTVDGLKVVGVPRMLCDLGQESTVDALRPLFIDARRRRLADVASVARTVSELGRAPGTAAVRELLRTLTAGVGDSELEWRWRRVLERHGLHPDDAPVYVAVSGGRLVQVDIPFAAYRVGLETDSQGFHADRASLDADALRHNGLMVSGWTVLRATWSHLRTPAPIVSALREALLGRGWPGVTA